eukprot:6208913-Pleurochrysis_carterae.AAC.5
MPQSAGGCFLRALINDQFVCGALHMEPSSGPVLMQACRVDVHVVVAELQVNLSGLALLGFRDSYGAEQGHLLAGARKSAPRCAAAWVA